MSIRYDNLVQIEVVVRGFEACSTPKEDFSHGRHLTVALWYLNNYPFDQAANQMRAGLFQFIEHHDVPTAKYNETITLFWLKVVSAFLAAQTSSDVVQITNALLQTYPDPNLVFAYYSRERISTAAAKTGWVEPDVKQFDF